MRQVSRKRLEVGAGKSAARLDSSPVAKRNSSKPELAKATENVSSAVRAVRLQGMSSVLVPGVSAETYSSKSSEQPQLGS